jgi:hypothetical protein
MMPDQHGWLFPVVCAGLGLFLAGALNLALARRRAGIRAVTTLAAGGLAVAAAAALNVSGAPAETARLFALGLLPCLLLGSRRATAGVAAAVASLHRPAVRFGLLTVAGLGIAVGAVVVHEWVTEREAAALLDEMDLIQGVADAVPTDRARATTDRGTVVVLKEPTASRDQSEMIGPEEKMLRNTRLDDQVIRIGPPDDRSNCHGWVFTGGRFVVGGAEVDKILKENGYEEVYDPRPGDLAVYRAGGAVSHTAKVRYVTEGQPVLVEGKWGTLGVFLHPADKSPYGTDYTFYRSARRGHLLAGVGGPPATGSPQPTLVTE